MIEGDSEAGEVDNGGEGTPWLEKKGLNKKEKWGIRKAEIVQEKREQVM